MCKMTNNQRRKWKMREIFMILVSITIKASHATIACNTTSDCERLLRPGSVCVPSEQPSPGWVGSCDNPFQKGCLRTMLGDKYNVRTCSSHDGEDARTLGLCRDSPLDYMEISINPANWESAMFYGWAVQIILSELVDVPVHIDTGIGGGNLSFYDPNNSFAYSKTAANFEGLVTANKVGDCRNVDRKQNITCTHFLPELWQGERDVDEKEIERDGNGEVGHVGWYVPRWVIKEHPSVASYMGLQGENSRKLLAELFRQPTTWKDYCDLVSTNGCLDGDGIASRPPAPGIDGEPSSEEGKYFVAGLYEGYFRTTERNDCSKNETCLGHIIDYPCTWSAYTKSQLYWNDIMLEADVSYTYSEMIQIMKASNATKSPAMFVWWYPDAIIEQYDFYHLTMTPASTECLKNRPEPKPNRCSASFEELIGSEVGSCGYNSHSFEKVFASTLKNSLNAPEAIRSPAYSTLRNIRISDIEISEMMQNWIQRGVDTYGYDPREAVCDWVAKSVSESEIFRSILRFVPYGYPRIVQAPDYQKPYLYAAMAFAALMIGLVLFTAGAVYHFQYMKIIKRAQIHFLYQFCVGFFLVLVGAIIHALPPTDGSCVSRYWFVTIGYTQGIVPILIKVAAINRLMGQAKRLKKTVITRSYLRKCDLVATAIIVVYLIIWTVLDPPSRKESLHLTSDNVVEVSLECRSNSNRWIIGPYIWETLFTFCAAILAFQSRKMTKDFNESREIGNMSYSHFLFLMLRLVVEFAPFDNLNDSAQQAMISFLISGDSLLALLLYFGPKLYKCFRNEDDTDTTMSTRMTFADMRSNLSRQNAGINSIYLSRRSSVNSAVTLDYPNESGAKNICSDESKTFDKRISFDLGNSTNDPGQNENVDEESRVCQTHVSLADFQSSDVGEDVAERRDSITLTSIHTSYF